MIKRIIKLNAESTIEINDCHSSDNFYLAIYGGGIKCHIFLLYNHKCSDEERFSWLDLTIHRKKDVEGNLLNLFKTHKDALNSLVDVLDKFCLYTCENWGEVMQVLNKFHPVDK